MMDKNNGIEFIYFKGKENCNVNLIFIHGSGCNKEFLKPMGEYLSKYNCYFIDLPSHGNSVCSGYDFDNYVNSVANFAKDLKNVILIGHSLGGTIVLGILAKYKSIVKGGVVLSSAASYPKLNKDFMRKIHDGIIDMDYLLECAGNTDDPAVLDSLRVMNSEKAIIEDFLICEKVSVEEEIRQIDVPVIIITGKEEILTIVEYSEFINRNIEKSSMIIIPDTKHMLPIVKRKELGEIISKFVDDLN